MHPSGIAEVERAKNDGRWQAAYAGQVMFDILTRQNRYAVLYRIADAKRAETRARRIKQFVAMLARGETVYPQKRTMRSG